MAICSATTACASKNASLTSGLRPVEKLSPTIGTTNRPFTGILPLSQRVAHAHCLSRVWVKAMPSERGPGHCRQDQQQHQDGVALDREGRVLGTFHYARSS